MRVAAGEAREAVGVQGRAAVQDVVGREAAQGQHLEAVAGVDDRVGVGQHPVADRIVVGGVGDDAAGRRHLPVGAATLEAAEGRGQARGEELGEARLGGVGGIVGPIRIELRVVQQHGQPAAGDPGARTAHVEVDAPGAGQQLPAVAVGAQAAVLVEVDDGRLDPCAAAEADPGQRELALLGLPVLDEAARLAGAGHLDPRRLAQHLPEAPGPRPRGGDHARALDRAVRGEHRLDRALVAFASNSPANLKPVTSTPSTIRAPAPGPLRQVADRLHRVRPAASWLVQDRLDRRAPVRPGPGQVVAAALRADQQLRLIAGGLVLLPDRDQVVDLALRHGRDVADLAEAVPLGIGLEHLHRLADQVSHRRRAVVVADDAPGDARGARADPVLLQHEHLRPALGQAPGAAQPVHAAPDDHDLAGLPAAQSVVRTP